MITGTVLKGINNIFSVRTDLGIIECRIKGKILRGDQKEYNPLAPGDRVTLETDGMEQTKGRILDRMERDSVFYRWNKKRNAPQYIAANIDTVVCIASPLRPAFRPRFLDRVSVISAMQELPLIIVLNKSDQGIPPEVAERMDVYTSIGIDTVMCSAKTGTNIDNVIRKIRGMTAVFIGQSGVGKSSLLNILSPGYRQRTGKVSEKHNRGIHTTCYSVLIPCLHEIDVIDTPGIREIEVQGIPPEELDHYFPEFLPFIGSCDFQPCSHLHEPGCAVREKVDDGSIHQDRYESYARIFSSLDSTRR